MEDRLESETRLGESEVTGAFAPGAPGDSEAVEGAISEVSPETKLLISRCIDGSEPLDRPLKTWEPEKFSPRAVQACLLRAGGFKGIDIAKLLELEPATVSMFINHPYGKRIIASMLQHQGARVIDIKTKLDKYADALLDETFRLAIAEQDTKVLASVTFGMLDRAGYGPMSKVEHETKESSSLAGNSHLLQQISTALSESKAVARVTQHVKQKPPPMDAPSPGAVSRDPDARFSEAERPHSDVVPSAGLQTPRTGTDA